MASAFDLDQFAPAAVDFTLRKVTYVLDGDPDVDVVARMLRIEDSIREASVGNDTDAIVAAVQEGKKLIVELMLAADVDQDLSGLKLNTQQVMTLFALVLHGGSVAAVVAEAISMPTQEVGEDGEPVITAHSGDDEAGDEPNATPLRSASTSHERSSLSEDTAAGLLATGTA